MAEYVFKTPISHPVKNVLGIGKVPQPNTLRTMSEVEKWISPITHQFETFDDVISRLVFSIFLFFFSNHEFLQ